MRRPGNAQDRYTDTESAARGPGRPRRRCLARSRRNPESAAAFASGSFRATIPQNLAEILQRNRGKLPVASFSAAEIHLVAKRGTNTSTGSMNRGKCPHPLLEAASRGRGRGGPARQTSRATRRIPAAGSRSRPDLHFFKRKVCRLRDWIHRE